MPTVLQVKSSHAQSLHSHHHHHTQINPNVLKDCDLSWIIGIIIMGSISLLLGFGISAMFGCLYFFLLEAATLFAPGQPLFAREELIFAANQLLWHLNDIYFTYAQIRICIFHHWQNPIKYIEKFNYL